MDSAPKRVHRRIRIVKHDKYIHIFSYRATFFSFYASFFEKDTRELYLCVYAASPSVHF